MHSFFARSTRVLIEGGLSLSPTNRAILASSARGITQPKIISSISFAVSGCLCNNVLAIATDISDAVKYPGRPRAFNMGLRSPSTTYTGLPDMIVISLSNIQAQIRLPQKLSTLLIVHFEWCLLLAH